MAQLIKITACNAGGLGSTPGLSKFPWKRERLPTPVESWRSPWTVHGFTESDTTEWLSLVHQVLVNFSWDPPWYMWSSSGWNFLFPWTHIDRHYPTLWTVALGRYQNTAQLSESWVPRWGATATGQVLRDTAGVKGSDQPQGSKRLSQRMMPKPQPTGVKASPAEKGTEWQKWLPALPYRPHPTPPTRACGVGEDSSESLGLQWDPTSPS